MNRTELFDYIKKNNLQEEVKAKFGKPYNSVSTQLLDSFVSMLKEADRVKEESKESKPVVPTDRKSLYEYIKNNNLQDYIKRQTGKNYTNVPTDSLNSLCNDWHVVGAAYAVKCGEVRQEIHSDNTEDTKTETSDKEGNDLTIRVEKLEKTVIAFAKILNLQTVLKNLD